MLYPSDPIQVISFYQELGFFSEMAPIDVVKKYEHITGRPLIISEAWDDVYLLTFESENRVWAGDPARISSSPSLACLASAMADRSLSSVRSISAKILYLFRSSMVITVSPHPL